MDLQVLGNTLDKEQTKAALCSNKNNIIIAGAGSGKSLTMVGKIKYLVNYQNVKLEEILCITFTNEAAKSLENKITKELNKNNKVYTFHKLALEILDSYNIDYKIAPADLLYYVINEILEVVGEDYFKKLFLNNNYKKSEDFNNYKKTILRFLSLYIGNYYDVKYFDLMIKKARKRTKEYLQIIKKIYMMYNLEKTRGGLIDFDDMIYKATDLVKRKGIKKNYKYIIIDEYQDTSQVRENLVKEIINKTGAFITVVGDDFQSIYRFSGCDLNSFLDFNKRFRPVKKLYLTNTYRNSSELIKVAGSFIMKNNRQIKKNLKSNKHLDKPIVILYYKNERKDFLKALKFINTDNLMILGRNNNDIFRVIDNLDFKDKNIYYKTIHKSKGLEEDNILIINLSDKNNSLPSQIKDDDILKFVLKHKDIYPFEEERRLFYVGITRTKNYCYMFVPKNNPSIFVEELVHDYKKYIQIINL